MKGDIKTRIVKRTRVDGAVVVYVIQQKTWRTLFRWKDAACGSCKTDSLGRWNYFFGLEDAKNNLKFYDGTEPIDEVVL